MKKSFYILKKEKLRSFLKTTMKDFRLISPQSASGGDFLFQETKDLERVDLNYDISSNSLKEFFFPFREAIFTYKKGANAFPRIIPIQERIKHKTLFFGVHSCDIRAVYFQDQFFTREPKDFLYWRKRDEGILISFACNKPPHQNCFCVYTQSGPFLDKEEGFDLQFIDLSNEYLVEIGTVGGENLIKRYKKFFTLANKDPLKKKSTFKDNCLKKFNQKYDLLNIYSRLKDTDLQSLWQELGKRCTGCGGCEFICPTCFCFFTQDIRYSQDDGERIRAWDSCVFSGYSRMAQEVNPHEKNSDRISRRFFCKLYNCYNWFRVFACTGCGRCSFVCPVNLDMESFIASLSKVDKYEPLLKAV